MTREDIIRMAREAEKLWVQHGDEFDSNRFLEIFAALVAEAEREVILAHCEAVCKAQAAYGPPPSWMQLMDFIRARGSK